MTTPTCWFWHWTHGGPVKIRLRNGQVITHHSGGPTDEGYHQEQHTWRFDGEWVTCSFFSWSMDCDGRLDTHSGRRCHVGSLRLGSTDPDDPTIKYPAWRIINDSQRDYSAEAAGY